MTSPIRVLHVDDDPGFIEITTDFLQAEHDHFEVEVETATSVAEGHDYLRGGRSTASSRTTRCRA